MAKLLVDIPNELIGGVAEYASRQDCTMENAVILLLQDALGGSQSQPLPVADIDAIVQQAQAAAKLRNTGSRFVLMDVVPSVTWERLSPGERKSLGKRFRKAIDLDPQGGVVFDDRTITNQAQYLVRS